MKNEELEIKKYIELMDEEIAFQNELNRGYSELCSCVRKKKWHFRYCLVSMMRFIAENWEQVDKLTKEDLYMALNVIKLVRSLSIETYKSYYDSEKFHEMCENYVNSR